MAQHLMLTRGKTAGKRGKNSDLRRGAAASAAASMNNARPDIVPFVNYPPTGTAMQCTDYNHSLQPLLNHSISNELITLLQPLTLVSLPCNTLPYPSPHLVSPLSLVSLLVPPLSEEDVELCEIASELLEDLPRMPVQAHPALISAITSLFREWVEAGGDDRTGGGGGHSTSATPSNNKHKKQAALDYSTQQPQYNAQSAQGLGLPYQPMPLMQSATGGAYEGARERGNNNNNNDKGMVGKGDKRGNQQQQQQQQGMGVSPNRPLKGGGKGARGSATSKGGRDSSTSSTMMNMGGPYAGGMTVPPYQGQGLAQGTTLSSCHTVILSKHHISDIPSITSSNTRFITSCYFLMFPQSMDGSIIRTS